MSSPSTDTCDSDGGMVMNSDCEVKNSLKSTESVTSSLLTVTYPKCLELMVKGKTL